MQHWLSVDGNAALTLQVFYNGGINTDTYQSKCRMDRVYVKIPNRHSTNNTQHIEQADSP
nr:hypothetical protein [uncultured Desulfobacter sp.]